MSFHIPFLLQIRWCYFMVEKVLRKTASLFDPHIGLVYRVAVERPSVNRKKKLQGFTLLSCHSTNLK